MVPILCLLSYSVLNHSDHKVQGLRYQIFKIKPDMVKLKNKWLNLTRQG